MNIKSFKIFSYLVYTRIIQFLAPLVIYPFLIKTVGFNNYGEITFWLGLSSFIANFCSLNMETYASKEVLFANGNEEIKRAIIIPTLLKTYVCFVCVIIWMMASFLFSNNIMTTLLIVFSIHPFLSIAMMPTHYFMAKGDFRLQFFSMLIEKITLIALFFIFIRKEDDYYFIPLITFVSVSLSSFYCVHHLIVMYKMKCFDFIISWVEFKKYFSVSLFLFLGKLTQLQTNAARFLVGYFIGYTEAAIYDICEKIVNVCKIPMIIINQYFFSKIGNEFKSVMTLFFFHFLTFVLVFFMFYIFDDIILKYFVGEEISVELTRVYHIMLLILISVPFVLTFGSSYLVKCGADKLYGHTLLFCNVISMSFLLILYITNSVNIISFTWWVVWAECSFSGACVFFSLRYMIRRY